MLEVHGEHRDGGLPSTQELLQSRQQRLARDLEPCRRLDLILERASFIETLRAAKPTPYVRAPAERAIKLIEPHLAQPPYHATPRQPDQIPDGAQSHAEELRE